MLRWTSITCENLIEIYWELWTLISQTKVYLSATVIQLSWIKSISQKLSALLLLKIVSQTITWQLRVFNDQIMDSNSTVNSKVPLEIKMQRLKCNIISLSTDMLISKLLVLKAIWSNRPTLGSLIMGKLAFARDEESALLANSSVWWSNPTKWIQTGSKKRA